MDTIKVAELFAGVGGFRLALDGYKSTSQNQFNMPAAGPFKTIWANQWEPPGTVGKQFAAQCYQKRFGAHSLVNEDINVVLSNYEQGICEIPAVDMVVGGFPCQDYSVAKPLSASEGIQGKKGVLWWDIYRFLELIQPSYVLLENVDRLLSSPAANRGRDFAIMLSCFYRLGYSVEWQIINSGAYGFNQRRKRIYMFACKDTLLSDSPGNDPEKSKPTHNLSKENQKARPSFEPSSYQEKTAGFNAGLNVISSAFPFKKVGSYREFSISDDPYKTSSTYRNNESRTPFLAHGCMLRGKVSTVNFLEDYQGELGALKNVLVPEARVSPAYYLGPDVIDKWRYLKGSKKEKRINKKTGFEYCYSEGAMSFPDAADKPSRTILTGEGGSGPSRFKHVVAVNGKYRRLVPEELEQLQGFPKGWTDTGMTDGQRAFCMGNALVVGVVYQIGKELYRQILERDASLSLGAHDCVGASIRKS